MFLKRPSRTCVQGTLARVTNVGGSFTALVIAAGIAWLIRRLRSAASSASLSDTTKLAASGKWGTVPVLSPAAVSLSLSSA